MENEILIALLVKKVEERFAELAAASPLRGPRGQRGVPGRDGASFNIEEHSETIRSWAKEFAIKFEDFTPEQIRALRGPSGRDGKNGLDGKDGTNGRDGKDFKFEDLTAEQISSLRGPEGRPGRDGKSFELTAEVSKEIYFHCKEAIEQSSDSLKLKFSDLTEDEISALRGPRGRDGKDGKDGKSFQFEEHRAFFEGLKPKFSDFTAAEIETLRLKFADLTEEEKATLKLRFTDLTEEDRQALRGARGARGQRGKDGRDGIDGKEGPKGRDGKNGKYVIGPKGERGRDGRDGEDGKDAPYITDIAVDRGPKFDEIEFTFEFSDGTSITTNAVRIPQAQNVFISAGGGGAPGGGNGGQGLGTFTSSIGAADIVDVDIVDETTFGAIEYGLALKKGAERSFKKIVVNKSASDFVDSWIDWDDVIDVDTNGTGASVETIWQSSTQFDLNFQASIVGGFLSLTIRNNEASPVQVSGARTLYPVFP